MKSTQTISRVLHDMLSFTQQFVLSKGTRGMFKIGVFDHVDKNDLPGTQFYEARLKLIEIYDRAGFYAYHCAEHHLAPIGMVPSPSVFLAAVVQRTKRLRFGPLVYVLPSYHPLRLLEEICLLDQM